MSAPRKVRLAVCNPVTGAIHTRTTARPYTHVVLHMQTAGVWREGVRSYAAEARRLAATYTAIAQAYRDGDDAALRAHGMSLVPDPVTWGAKSPAEMAALFDGYAEGSTARAAQEDARLLAWQDRPEDAVVHETATWHGSLALAEREVRTYRGRWPNVRIVEVPPPEAPPRVGDPSPWGPVEAVTVPPDLKDVPGVLWVSTASHGGFWLAPERRGVMAARLPGFRPFTGSLAWWEEDLDAVLVDAVLLGTPESVETMATPYVRDYIARRTGGAA